MDALECRDCGLGLKFSTKEELQNHQKKFCANSHYNDPHKMEVRLAGLRREADNQLANLPLGDIRDYIQGKNEGSQPYGSNQRTADGPPLNDPYGLKAPGPRGWQNDPTMTELEKQALELKDNRTKQRAQREHAESNMMDLLQDLQNRKEHELRAQIEKEEIARAIKSANQGADPADLYNLEKLRKQELQKLASDREALRIQEQNLFEEVGKMEADLIKGQQSYGDGAESRNDFNVHYETEQRTRNEQLQGKQNEFAQQRAAQVAKIKLEREKLEHDRQRIMRELNDLNQKKQSGPRADSRGSYRGNAAAIRAGSMLAGNKPPSSYSNQREGGALEPSLKDKIVRDQMRLNKLKEDARSMPQLPQEFDGISAMQRERRQQQNPYDKIHALADDFANKNIPNKGQMLGDIRRQIEEDDQHPYSVPKPTSSKAHDAYSGLQENTPGHRQKVNDDKLVSMLNDLEGMVVGQQHQSPNKRPPKSGRPPLIPTSQQAHPVYNSMPAQQVAPWQMPQMQMQPPIQAQPQDQFGYQQQPAYPPAGPPQYDPAMAQIATLLRNQDEENRKLRHVLENFGKNAPTVEQLDSQLTGTNQQLMALRKDPSVADRGHGDRPVGYHGQAADGSIPDDFMFKQNEERNTDLETEERAIMNLQAQEFDQLRLIQKLPKDSDLYKFKMQQFKELSVMRAESEKMLQQQKLEKLQRDFSRQKNEDDRVDQHQQWLEQQKRQILEAKMGVQPQPMSRHSAQRSMQPAIRSQTNFNPPMSQSNLLAPPLSDHIGIQDQLGGGGAREMAQDRILQPSPLDRESNQFLIQFDYAHLLPRQVRQLKIVASIFRGEQLLGEPQQAGPIDAEADPSNKNCNKVYFAKKTLFMFPEKRTADTRILFELQAVDAGQVTGFTGFGWTWINLFEERNLDLLRGGMWSLPVYVGPTRPAVAQNKMKRPSFAPGVALAIRIGYPGEHVFRSRPAGQVNLDESPVPKEHEGAAAQILRLQGQPGQAATAKFPEPPRRESAARRDPAVGRESRDQGDLRRQIVKQGPDPNFHSSGINVKVHYAQNLRPLKKLTLRATVQQGTKGPITVDGQECVFKSPTGQEAAIVEVKAGDVVGVSQEGELVIEDVTQLRRSQTTHYLEANITDTVVRPIDNFDFKVERDLHDLYWNYDGEDMIYLVVEVYAETTQSQGRKRVSWALSELVNPEDGKINYGFHNAPLLMPPMTFKKSEQQVLEGESVGFTITDLDDVRQATLMSDKRSQKSVPMSEQFLPNFEKQNTLSGNWLDTDALDIYVDGARHLPDNVTLTKVTAKVIETDLKQVGVGQFGTVLVHSSTLRNQNYGMKLELRSKARIPPTSLLFLTIQTIDNSKLSPCVVGYSYFPLFFNVDEQMPAVSNGDKKVSPLTGCYQMPIFYARPREEKPFNYEKFIYLERVPTASILVRVLRAGKDPKTGLPVKAADLTPEQQQQNYLAAPKYSDGVYSTQYYSITEDERKIMSLRRMRPNPQVQDVAQLLSQNMRMGVHEVIEHIQRLEHTANTPAIDLTYYSQYEPGLGIRVNVEAIHDNKIEGFFGVLASVTPPASHYDEQRGDAQDTFIFTEPDFDGHHRTFKFSEGDALVMGFTPTQPGMSLFFDIKVWLPKKKQFEPYGFTLVPLVETLETDADTSTYEYYVSSGVFSLPVYKGNVDRQMIQQLKASTNPLALLKSFRQQNIIQLLGNTSLIVRIVDTQRKMHFLRSFEQQAPSTKYLEPEQLSSLKYKPISGGLLGGPKKIREMVPSEFKGKEQKFNEFIEESFQKHVGL